MFVCLWSEIGIRFKKNIFLHYFFSNFNKIAPKIFKCKELLCPIFDTTQEIIITPNYVSKFVSGRHFHHKFSMPLVLAIHPIYFSYSNRHFFCNGTITNNRYKKFIDFPPLSLLRTSHRYSSFTRE